MKEERFENLKDIVVVGLAVRTSLATAATDIPALWKRFMEEGTVARLPRRADDPSIYAVYCDYESDGGGPYTMVLGVAVDPSAEVSPGMRRVRIPGGRFARFRVEGDPSQVIWQVWSYINGPWDGRRSRRYIADFERYAPESMSPSSVKADIVVGLDDGS